MVQPANLYDLRVADWRSENSFLKLTSGRWTETILRRYLLPPPYLGERPWDPPTDPQRGTMVVLEPAESVQEQVAVGTICSEIRDLRRELDVSVILRLATPKDPALLPLLSALTQSGAIALVSPSCRGSELADTVRRRHKAQVAISEEWIRWLELHRQVKDPARSEISSIIQTAHSCQTLVELCRSVGLSPRTVRSHFQKTGLPRPGKWFYGARLIRAQLWLVSDQHLRIGAVAQRLDYSDGHTLSNMMYRVFGVTARQSRQLLGLTWPFAAWRDWALRP